MQNKSLIDKILSTNFAIALLIFLANLFGISSNIATDAVGLITGIAAFVGMLREAIKSAAFIGWKNLLSGNSFNYLVALAATLTPYAEQLAPSFKRILDAIAAKDVAQIISAAISLIVMLYYLFVAPDRKPKAK